MEEIGQARRTLVAGPAVAWAVAAVTVAGLQCAATWPFAIDDAWISVRYARHLVEGVGYVWNDGSAATDGVTPLPWAFLLAPLAHAGAAVVLTRSKLLGAVVWAGAAAFWGRAIGRLDRPSWVKLVAVLVLALDLPVAAHVVSGMETSLALALATIASVVHARPRAAAALAGLAATLRPELVVWGLVLAVGFSLVAPRAHDDAPSSPTGRLPEAWLAGAIAAAPFFACAAIRAVVFGHPAPLSVLAKPSDLSHGLSYLGAAAIFSLAPVLLVAPVSLARERGPALVLALAALAHGAAIAAVGGDWMPYARLMAPIVPSMLYAFVLLARYGNAGLHVARAAIALSLGAWLTPHNLRALRAAGADRAAMIASAQPLLTDARTVAALDVGWVSAVFEGRIVDLAGVTDPEIASLGGGHTSKRIDATLLLARGVDLAVFYADPLPPTLDGESGSTFPRVVEARLAASTAFREHFAPAALLPLGERGAGYVLFRRTR